ncbi:MAG: cytochrome c biogenesis protein CcsA [Chloroflexota bacterium]|jgi:cytochrome c-type biogenesis protein CcsB|nr:cytochrome c biogenesis protein CcsA [Chloroflexota bacterium]MDH5243140.1 cytochrome c biogenesis protein CcsA [Chloroflexota bacterium]
MTLAELSSVLFSVGAIVVALAFAAHVGHAVMLANGRRALSAIGVTNGMTKQPAYAGVVTGSFVAAQARDAARGPVLAAAPSPLTRAATWLTWAAVLTLGIAVLLRGIAVERGPWGNMYEFTVAFSFSMLAGYALLARRYAIRAIGFIPTGVALALLLYASSLPSEISPLVPALQNAPLLTIHVGMAVLSYGIFATSFAAGVAYLIQGQGDRYAWLPSHKVLDEVAYRSVIIGFPIFATMIILGSWWASIAWSRYWGWDPKETAALVTWLTYAVYLHARNRRSWAGRPAALLLVVGFAMVLVTYSGSLWFSGLHAYSGL